MFCDHKGCDIQRQWFSIKKALKSLVGLVKTQIAGTQHQRFDLAIQG